MSRTSAILRNQYEKNIKHQRQVYMFSGNGSNIIEIGWIGIFKDFIDWIKKVTKKGL